MNLTAVMGSEANLTTNHSTWYFRLGYPRENTKQVTAGIQNSNTVHLQTVSLHTIQIQLIIPLPAIL